MSLKGKAKANYELKGKITFKPVPKGTVKNKE